MINPQTKFSEQNQPNIFAALNTTKMGLDRYHSTKMLQIMCNHELALAYTRASGKHPEVIFNAVNPGFCKTALFRNWITPFRQISAVFHSLLGRTPEEGSRTILHAAFAGVETQGRMMMDNHLMGFPSLMLGDAGVKLGKRTWDELVDELEKIEPGVTKEL